jgi:hypothetical protein
MAVARKLKYLVDSLQTNGRHPKIMILGDFNDESNDENIQKVLVTQKPGRNILSGQLYNLSYPDFQAGKGTLVYKEINNTWFLFDQIFVSGSFISNKGLITQGRKSIIFEVP